MMKKSIVVALTAVLSLGPALAQPPEPPLDPSDAFALTVDADAAGNLGVAWDVQPGYYLYRSKIAVTDEAGTNVPLNLPSGEVYDDPWLGMDEIFRTPVATTIPAFQGTVTLHWQGCQQDGICYAPQKEVLAADGSIGSVTVRTPPAFDSSNAASRSDSGFVLAQDEGIVAGLAVRGGAVLVVLGFLGFGLLLSMTPCVLPMVPIVAGMLTRQGDRLTAKRGLALTGAYVLAMASAFGLLGVVAAWSGANLQAVLQSPFAIGIIAAIFVGLALSMFGLFEMQMPASLQARLTSRGSAGTSGTIGGAAALGFGSALIVGPCVTAPLAGALIYIAQTGDVALGAAALFALGLGQGIPLLAVGAFGPRILPRRGAWMEQVKQAFGVVFLGLAIWLAGRILPGPVVLALWAVLLIGCGVALGALDRLPPKAAQRARMTAATGVLLLFAGVVQGLGAALGADDPVRPLAPLVSRLSQENATELAFDTVTTQAGLNQALAAAQDRPALIYVTADWCVICRKIERGPMADPAVMAAMQDLVLVKLDVTDFDAGAQALMADLAVAGPPTLLFLDADRVEPEGSRLIGDVSTRALIASVPQVTP